MLNREIQRVDQLAALRAEEAQADKRIETLVAENHRSQNGGAVLEPVGGYLRGNPDQTGIPSYSGGAGYHQEIKFPKGNPPETPFYSNFNGDLKQEAGVRKNGTYCLEKRPPWHNDFDSQLGSKAGESLKQKRNEKETQNDALARREAEALRKENADLRRAHNAPSVAGNPAHQGSDDHDMEEEGVELATLRKQNIQLR